MREHLVLSFQENGTDVWGSIRDRLRTGKGRIAAAGTDYLLHSLIDAVVDNYFAVVELIGEQLERMKDRLLAAPIADILRELHGLKREMLFVRSDLAYMPDLDSRWGYPLVLTVMGAIGLLMIFLFHKKRCF